MNGEGKGISYIIIFVAVEIVYTKRTSLSFKRKIQIGKTVENNPLKLRKVFAGEFQVLATTSPCLMLFIKRMKCIKNAFARSKHAQETRKSL